MDPDRRLARLAKYLTGTLDPSERAEAEAWLAGDGQRRSLLNDVARVWSGSPDEEWDVEGAHRAVWAKIRTAESAAGRRAADRAARGGPRRGRSRWPKAVTVALGTVALVVGVWLTTPSEDPAATWEAVAVAEGQTARVRLSDGSTVVLNAGSTLRYPSPLAPDLRVVQLDGEAVFEVESDPDRPFEVHTDLGRTRVLGTRFLVSGYPETDGLTVAVDEGRVAVSPDSSAAVAGDARQVTAGEVARLRADAVEVAPIANPAALFGWTDDRSVFERTPITVVAARLGRRYGLSIEVAPALQDQAVTITLASESADQALRALALTLGARVEREGDTARLVPTP